MMMISSEQLYNEASNDWQRTDPILLSDFTARPFLLEWAMPVKGLDVLDLGCGEGYFGRNLMKRGAGSLLGIDISAKMIEGAKQREQKEPYGINFRTGSATDLSGVATGSLDLVVAVFLFNYLDLEQTQRTMTEVHRVLRPGGRFVFAVPHPSLAFLGEQTQPFYFDAEGKGYFSGRNHQFEGRIWRRDGKNVPVRSVHKNVEDYFVALANAGWQHIPDIAELHVTEEHLKLDPKWFGPLRDKPLHLAFRLTR